MGEGAAERTVDEITVPWRVEVLDDFYVILDPTRTEICRVHYSNPLAEELAKMICALPWLMMACKRTLEQLDQAATKEGKTGMTLRQWVRNHEGMARRDELRDAVKRAFHGIVPPRIPESYGVNQSSGPV